MNSSNSERERFQTRAAIDTAEARSAPMHRVGKRVLLTRAGVTVALLLGALVLRLWTIDRLPMWVDEAESTINAFTILQHGVPMGTYHGMPVYENTHITPWPDSNEYRYKDVSYSKRGLAVYHGWLPLYSIAAALTAFGVEPIGAHDAADVRKRTIVPRIPAVVFGVVGILLFYLAGKLFYGTETGLAAAIVSATSPMHIYISQQARYFAATVTVSVLCGYATWQLLQRRRWRDCVLCGIAFGALFHTHILSFTVAVVMLALAAGLFRSRGHPVPWALLSVSGCITTALVLPWMLATDFLYTAAVVPAAWRLMELPQDLIPYRLAGIVKPAAIAAVIVALAAVFWIRRSRAAGLRRALLRIPGEGHALVFLALWLVVAYTAFVFLIPAASYALARIVLLLLAPLTLLVACACGIVARALVSHSAARPTSAVIALAVTGAAYVVWPTQSDAAAAMHYRDIHAAVSFITGLSSRPERRIYANPNDHLLLTYYSGMPVQSIAPVREEFLNAYRGDIVLFLRHDFFVHPGDAIDPKNLQQAARQAGIPLSAADAGRLSFGLATREYRTSAAVVCERVVPPPVGVPEFLTDAYREWLRIRDQRDREYAAKWVRFPMLRGFQIRSITHWWTVFFLRFANPERELLHPNYERRMRRSIATVLPGSNWAVYCSPGTSSF